MGGGVLARAGSRGKGRGRDRRMPPPVCTGGRSEADVAEPEMDLGPGLAVAGVDQPGEIEGDRDLDREADAEADRGAEILVADLLVLGPDVAAVDEGDGADALVGHLHRHRQLEGRERVARSAVAREEAVRVHLLRAELVVVEAAVPRPRSAVAVALVERHRRRRVQRVLLAPATGDAEKGDAAVLE